MAEAQLAFTDHASIDRSVPVALALRSARSGSSEGGIDKIISKSPYSATGLDLHSRAKTSRLGQRMAGPVDSSVRKDSLITYAPTYTTLCPD